MNKTADNSKVLTTMKVPVCQITARSTPRRSSEFIKSPRCTCNGATHYPYGAITTFTVVGEPVKAGLTGLLL